MYRHTIPQFKYKHHILCLPDGDHDSRGRAVWRVSICLTGLTAICHVNTFEELFFPLLTSAKNKRHGRGKRMILSG